MKLAILNIFFILPILVTCQNLPTEELMNKGISQEEIDITNSLKGKNGINDYFLVVRQKDISQNSKAKMFINNFELLTPEGNISPLTNFGYNQSQIIYFEFLADEIVLIEKVFGLRNKIRISRYNIETLELITKINAEIACEFGNDCEWIRMNVRKLAFFTNLESNEGLEHSSVYEYNWLTNTTKLIYEELPFKIDAVTGRNFELKDVRYNEERNEFEYGQ